MSTKKIRQNITVKVITCIALAELVPAILDVAAAQEIQPLSPETARRVETLLKEFNPNSYSLDITVLDTSGRVSQKKLGNATGLTDSAQTAAERELAAAGTNVNNNIFRAASTNVNNNIFRAASTNVNNNIFRIASTNVNNNIFKAASTNVNNNIFKAASTNVNNNIFVNDHQADAARELNSIFEMNIGMRPLSREERKKVETLLREFDPNSYSLDVTVVDQSGKVSRERMGKAVGLSSLRQTSLEQEFASAGVGATPNNLNVFKVASTNVNNNIFRVASTNVNNNIFKVASTNVNNNIFKAASTNVNNNIFVNDRQAEAARELNEILSNAFANK